MSQILAFSPEPSVQQFKWTSQQGTWAVRLLINGLTPESIQNAMNCSEEVLLELIQTGPGLVPLWAADDFPPMITVLEEKFTEVEWRQKILAADNKLLIRE
jgi:hypothetical protein